MIETDLVEYLTALEVSLQSPELRKDRAAVELLLHPQFREVGRSGREYDRKEIISLLETEQADYSVVSQEFKLENLSSSVAALRYRSMRVGIDGSHSHFTLRVSIWQKTGDSWRLRFHQATPTAPLDPHSI